MTWYTTIAYWIVSLLIIGTICKTIVPKSFWAWCETKIIEWQTKSITGQYEFTERKKPGKWNKIIFLFSCLAVGILLSIYVNWWFGCLSFALLYFGVGLYLMQTGVIE